MPWLRAVGEAENAGAAAREDPHVVVVFRAYRTVVRAGACVAAVGVIAAHLCGGDTTAWGLALAGLSLSEGVCALAAERSAAQCCGKAGAPGDA